MIDVVKYSDKDQILFSEETQTVNGVKVSDYVMVGNKTYYKGKQLGEGGQGVVYQYRAHKNQLGIAVKYYLGEADREDSIYEHLIKNDAEYCNIIPVVARATPGRGKIEYLFVMPEMHGDLEDYLDKFDRPKTNQDFKRLFTIYNKVKQSVVCLAEFYFYYLDLKPEQVLYVKNPKTELGIDLYLGDLGSVVNGNNLYPKFAIYTFPHPRRCKGNLEHNSKRHLDWALGVFALLIADDKLDRFFDPKYCSKWTKDIEALSDIIDATYPVNIEYSNYLNKEVKYLLYVSNIMKS